MSTPNDNKSYAFELRDSTGNFLFPGMAGYEEALAKAQSKRGRKATQPQPPQGDNMADDVGNLKPYRLAIAQQNKQINALQARRDELLASLQSMVAAANRADVRMRDQETYAALPAARAAIARATSKQGLGGSDAESISTEGGQS